jgi:enoyl-CoA hydratase/carnithine racemase
MAASLTVERRGTTLVVILDRPEKLNAYDGETLHAIAQAWRTLDADPELRAGVLTGRGDEAFSVGADIGAVTEGRFGHGPFPELAENLAEKPLLAAIDGRCLGGGMMLATGCDVRIAAEHALFGLPEARWNLPAQWLGALAEQMLPAHVLELALWGDRWLPARRLHEMGWVSAVVPRGEALAEALRWADGIAAMAPRAVRRFKALLRARRHGSAAEALELGHRHAHELIRMADTREGAAAFRERRAPRWQDR